MLQTFKYMKMEVRVIIRATGPWFVGSDVTDVLEYRNSSKAIQDHCKHAELLKGNDSLLLTWSPRGITIIPESDVYRLIMRSNMPGAEAFQDWIVEEVLPTIRKTGSYTLALPNFEDPVAAARAWADQYEAKKEAIVQAERLAIEKKVVEEKLSDLEKSWKIHFDKDGTQLIEDVARIINYKDVGPRQIYVILKKKGILFNNHLGDVVPYKKHMNGQGYFKLTSIPIQHNHTRTINSKTLNHTTTHVTYKGTIWIRRLLEKWGYGPHKQKPVQGEIDL